MRGDSQYTEVANAASSSSITAVLTKNVASHEPYPASIPGREASRRAWVSVDERACCQLSVSVERDMSVEHVS
eukprot:COSAG01_NODE_1721_length_9391_cov_5.427249_11_plen_73_part_00